MIQRYRGQRHRDDSGLQPDVVCDNARYMRARPAPSRDRVPLAWDAAWPWSIPANRGQQPIWSTTGYVYPQNCPVTTKLQHVPTAPPLDQMATHGPGLSPSWICQTSATAEAAGLGHTTPTRTKQLPVRQHKTRTDRQRRPYRAPKSLPWAQCASVWSMGEGSGPWLARAVHLVPSTGSIQRGLC